MAKEYTPIDCREVFDTPEYQEQLELLFGGRDGLKIVTERAIAPFNQKEEAEQVLRIERMTTKLMTDAKSYEIVKRFSDGSELRRYTFYDGSVHSVIFEDGFIVEAVPIEKEDDMVAWWEDEIEVFKEVERWKQHK